MKNTELLQAIGAVDRAVVGLYDVGEKVYHKKEFTEPMELTSLLGTVTEKDGKPYLHVHITASRRDYTCVGGHLLDAKISGACELTVDAFPELKPGRRARVTIPLDDKMFASFDKTTGELSKVTGHYELLCGGSSEDSGLISVKVSR